MTAASISRHQTDKCVLMLTNLTTVFPGECKSEGQCKVAREKYFSQERKKVMERQKTINTLPLFYFYLFFLNIAINIVLCTFTTFHPRKHRVSFYRFYDHTNIFILTYLCCLLPVCSRHKSTSQQNLVLWCKDELLNIYMERKTLN